MSATTTSGAALDERQGVDRRMDHRLVEAERLGAVGKDAVLGRGGEGEALGLHVRLPARHVCSVTRARARERPAQGDHRERVARIAEGAQQDSARGHPPTSLCSPTMNTIKSPQLRCCDLIPRLRTRWKAHEYVASKGICLAIVARPTGGVARRCGRVRLYFGRGPRAPRRQSMRRRAGGARLRGLRWEDQRPWRQLPGARRSGIRTSLQSGLLRQCRRTVRGRPGRHHHGRVQLSGSGKSQRHRRQRGAEGCELPHRRLRRRLPSLYRDAAERTQRRPGCDGRVQTGVCAAVHATGDEK